jgi:hypothetical protein
LGKEKREARQGMLPEKEVSLSIKKKRKKTTEDAFDFNLFYFFLGVAAYPVVAGILWMLGGREKVQRKKGRGGHVKRALHKKN